MANVRSMLLVSLTLLPLACGRSKTTQDPARLMHAVSNVLLLYQIDNGVLPPSLEVLLKDERYANDSLRTVVHESTTLRYNGAGKTMQTGSQEVLLAAHLAGQWQVLWLDGSGTQMSKEPP